MRVAISRQLTANSFGGIEEFPHGTPSDPGLSRVLEGEYWTDRKTTGDLKLLFRTKVLSDHFDYKA